MKSIKKVPIVLSFTIIMGILFCITWIVSLQKQIDSQSLLIAKLKEEFGREESEGNRKNFTKKKYRLFINSKPRNVSVEFVNSKLTYKWGMKISEGTYHLKISGRGYIQIIKKIVVKDSDEYVNVKLNVR